MQCNAVSRCYPQELQQQYYTIKQQTKTAQLVQGIVKYLRILVPILIQLNIPYEFDL